MEDKRDVILKHLVNNPSQTYNQTSLQQELFKDLDEDQVEIILQSIIDYDSNLMRCYNKSGLGFIPVAYKSTIDVFLNNGGFTKLKAEALKLKEEKAEKELLEFRKLKAETELSEMSLKDYKTTKWLARIGFGISVILALVEIVRLFF